MTVWGGQNLLLLNDGTAKFTNVTATNLPVLAEGSHGVAAGDIDKDGDLDLVVGNFQGQNRILINDGKAKFTDGTAGRYPAVKGDTMDVVLADVDGDYDLDLFVANGLLGPVQDQLFRNDGTGKFSEVTATHMPAHAQPTFCARVADFDEDGDLDFFLAHALYSLGVPNRWLVNDGAASSRWRTPWAPICTGTRTGPRSATSTATRTSTSSRSTSTRRRSPT